MNAPKSSRALAPAPEQTGLHHDLPLRGYFTGNRGSKFLITIIPQQSHSVSLQACASSFFCLGSITTGVIHHDVEEVFGLRGN